MPKPVYREPQKRIGVKGRRDADFPAGDLPPLPPKTVRGPKGEPVPCDYYRLVPGSKGLLAVTREEGSDTFDLTHVRVGFSFMPFDKPPAAEEAAKIVLRLLPESYLLARDPLKALPPKGSAERKELHDALKKLADKESEE